MLQLRSVPCVHLPLSESAIPPCGVDAPLLTKLDEQASRGKSKDSDERKGQHDVMQSHTRDPRCESEDEDSGDDVTSERYSNNSICDDLSLC
jgi:hypothetical protein